MLGRLGEERAYPHVAVLHIFNCFAKLMVNVHLGLFEPQGAPDESSFTAFFSENQPPARIWLVPMRSEITCCQENQRRRTINSLT